MSYDVSVVKFTGTRPASPFEIQENDVIPLGAADEVRRAVSSEMRGTDWSDPTWGIFYGDGFSIEFNVGADDPIEHMMLHLRGGGDAMEALAGLVARFGWTAIDGQTDEFIDPGAPSDEGWKEWQGFRDRVAGDRGDAGEG